MNSVERSSFANDGDLEDLDFFDLELWRTSYGCSSESLMQE
jgi:hypothetical protein